MAVGRRAALPFARPPLLTHDAARCGPTVNYVDEARLGTQVRKFAKQPEGAYVSKSGFEKLVALTLKEFVTDTNKKQFAAAITDRLFSLCDVYAQDRALACMRAANARAACPQTV
jgi:hypothetical protein